MIEISEESKKRNKEMKERFEKRRTSCETQNKKKFLTIIESIFQDVE